MMSKVLPIRKPCSMKIIRSVASRYTICEELRVAFKNIEQGKLKAAKKNVRIAVTMAKAMSRKLEQYNSQVCNEMFPKKKEINGSK